MSLRVDKSFPERTCSQVLRSSSVYSWRFESIIIFRVEIYWNCNFVDLWHFKLLCSAKNHWWLFCTRNGHMVHIVNETLFKMVYTSWSLFIFQPLHSLGECHCWLTRESLRAHAAKFYDRRQLIRSVSRASTFSVLKFIEIVIFGVYSPSLLASACFGTFVITLFNFFSYFVWLRITDDVSVLEMGICSISLSLFSYCKSQAFTLNTLWGFCKIYAQSTVFVLARGGGGSTLT